MPLVLRRVSFVSFLNRDNSFLFKRFKSVLIKVPQLLIGDFIFKFYDDELLT